MSSDNWNFNEFTALMFNSELLGDEVLVQASRSIFAASGMVSMVSMKLFLSKFSGSSQAHPEIVAVLS